MQKCGNRKYPTRENILADKNKNKCNNLVKQSAMRHLLKDISSKEMKIHDTFCNTIEFFRTQTNVIQTNDNIQQNLAIEVENERLKWKS